MNMSLINRAWWQFQLVGREKLNFDMWVVSILVPCNGKRTIRGKYCINLFLQLYGVWNWFSPFLLLKKFRRAIIKVRGEFSRRSVQIEKVFYRWKAPNFINKYMQWLWDLINTHLIFTNVCSFFCRIYFLHIHNFKFQRSKGWLTNVTVT